MATVDKEHEREKRPEDTGPASGAGAPASGLEQAAADHGAVGATLYLDARPGAKREPGAAAVDQALAATGGGAVHESGARIHTGPVAEAAADALGARAFTAGSDVYFGAGQYQPGTAGGDALLRHELTHVEQTRGLAAPEPGRYRVSDPGEPAEQAARSHGAGGAGADAGGAASGASGTIYRDTTGSSPAPSPTGAPPAGAAPAGGADPWKAYQDAVTKYDKADATAKWAALGPPDKAKLKTDDSIQMRTMWTFNKEAVPILAQGGVDWSMLAPVLTVFMQPDFADWMQPLKTNNLFTSFIAAPPQKAEMKQENAKKLGAWINQGTDPEARSMFEKVYTKVSDSWSTYAPWTVTTQPWTKDTIGQLYNRISQFNIPIAHAQTIKGYYLVTQWTTPGATAKDPPVTHNLGGGMYYGSPWHEVWFTPAQTNQSAGLNADGTGKANVGGGKDGSGSGSMAHDGVGGDNAQSQTTAKNKLDHFTNAVLHEIGHGVGDRIQGNTWAETKFTKAASPEAWGVALWDASLDPAPPAAGAAPPAGELSATAKQIRAYILDKIAGKTVAPPGGYTVGDFEKFLAEKRKDQDLYKAWSVAKADAERYRNPYPKGGQRYAYLSRWSDSFATYAEDLWTERVSLYALSSPAEYFAEQYTEYYRPTITGGAKGSTMKTPAAKTFLDQIDARGFDPAKNTATGTAAAGPSGEGGADAASGSAAAKAPPTPRGIPWP